MNQIYFLHQKIQDLEDCLQETTDMLVEIKDTKKINKSFRQEIKIDNQKQNMIRNSMHTSFSLAGRKSIIKLNIL